LKVKKKADILMSTVDKFANQPINDALIDELTDLLYEAAIRSSTPRKDIRRIVCDFLEGYTDADKILCSVCKETKTDYVRQQWHRMWLQVVRRIQQQESANGSIL
jgi:hypothetical protein